MISLYGPGFIGRNFYHMYEGCTEIVNKDDRIPKSNDILYTISTVDNYNVHDKITLDVDTNLHVLCEVLDHCRSEDITFNFLSSWFVYGKEHFQQEKTLTAIHKDSIRSQNFVLRILSSLLLKPLA